MMLLHLRTSCSAPLATSLLLQKPDLANLKAMILSPLDFTCSKQDQAFMKVAVCQGHIA